MKTLIHILFHRIVSVLRDRWYLQLEHLALRHQLEVLKRSAKRPRFDPADRGLWVLLSRCWPEWAQALELMQADTVRRWRRQGIWHHLRWRRGRKRSGRPPIPLGTRNLIREMSRDNRLWGAPRIHGELAKLGIKVSRTTVAKYMNRRSYPPSPTWRTFIRDQAPDILLAEVYGELSGRSRAVSRQMIKAFQRWLGWLVLSWLHSFGRCQARPHTERIGAVSLPAISTLDRTNRAMVSGRSPPGSRSSSSDHSFYIYAELPMGVGRADVRLPASAPQMGAVLPPTSRTLQKENKEQSTEGYLPIAA